ncbi:Abi family protein [Subtercola lobariae]|uniref:Abi family protein n=1 Tax=Subtercola lobariae TaxID=1588641 RepID=A0A917B4U0_9MICO|nr:Abi family protein [Subtercola lobariae]GGF21907.1 abi family protein [Subtercola lobariae]
MLYTKLFTEREDLLDQLEDRGLAVPDRAEALAFLTRVGYFRSGAYRYVFRLLLPPAEVSVKPRQYRSDNYISGASFSHVSTLESFDSKLTRICLEGLLDCEIRLRAAIAHTLAARNVAAHAYAECLDDQKCRQFRGATTKFEAWLQTCDEAIRSAAEDEDFITHHLLKYPEQPVPIWAVTEVLSFGKLPYLFELMKTEDAREVARQFGFIHPRAFGAVLRMMVDFRNVCAHGSRLFNRAFKRSLAIKMHETAGDLLEHLTVFDFTETPKPQQRLYIYAAVLGFMLRSHSAGSTWHLTFKTQIRKFDIDVLAPDGALLLTPAVSMGFPRDWQELPLWK